MTRRQKQTTPASSAEEAIKDIRRATRRHWSAEDKIRIVLEGLREEDSISDDVRPPIMELALKASGLDHVTVVHRPRLLSDNGSS